jgi:type VI secretion system protein
MARLRLYSTATILALLLVVSGCSSVTSPLRKASHLSGQITLDVTIAPAANNDAPIAVDMVAISDKKILTEVSTFPAAAWFAKRKDYVRLHSKEVRVYSWEWVPGQQVVSIKIPETALADGVILFANYASPGAHSVMLPKSGIVRIDLGPEDLQLLPASK